MITPCLGSSESLPPPQLVRCATKPRACLPRRGPSWATYPPELFEGMEARPSVARALLDRSRVARPGPCIGSRRRGEPGASIGPSARPQGRTVRLIRQHLAGKRYCAHRNDSRRLTDATVGIIGFVFDNWSGARDLNPGPHAPEPSWWSVPACPAGSAEVRLNSNCPSTVSIRVLVEPPGARNLCPGCARRRLLRSP